MTRSRPPGPPAGWLGLRQACVLRRDPLGFVRDLHRRFGDVVHFRLGPHSSYLLAHPDHVHDVLVRQARQFHKTARFKRAFGRFEGDGLLTADGDHWTALRRSMQSALPPASVDAIRRLADRTFDRWAVPGVVDLSAEMGQFAIRAVASTMFGTDADDLADGLAAAAPARQRWTQRELNRVIPTPRWIPLVGASRRAQTLLRRLAVRIIRGHPGGLGGLGRDQVAGLFLAGFETTAVALAWAGWLLARHPAIQDRIAAAPDGPEADRAFRETLRLYPPVHLFTRQAVGQVEVAGYTLPTGSQVFLSPFLTQRDPRWFPDPERFDPSRFAPDAEAARPASAWFPFGAGPRACLGRGAALLIGATVLARLASRFELEPTADPEPVGRLFLVPGEAIRVTVRPRGHPATGSASSRTPT